MAALLGAKRAKIACTAILTIAVAGACSREQPPLTRNTMSPPSASAPAAGVRTPDVAIHIGKAGVAVTAPAATAVDCNKSVISSIDGGDVDGSALGRCVRDVQAALGDRASSAVVRVNAEPEIPNQSLVRVFDAMRTDAAELFANVSFGSPSANASISLEVVPSRPAAGGKDDEGFVVILSKTRLLANDNETPLAEYDLAEIAKDGLPGKYKDHGRADFVISPLAAIAKRYRKADREAREQKHEPPTSTATIVADASVPYRLLFEVLYTLQQADVRGYRFLTRQSAR